jgi:hypothetical protein
MHWQTVPATGTPQRARGDLKGNALGAVGNDLEQQLGSNFRLSEVFANSNLIALSVVDKNALPTG